MAFSLDNFVVLAGQGKRGESFQYLGYKTGDSIDDLLSENYFVNLIGKVSVNDLIIVQIIDVATEIIYLRVTSIDVHGVIEVERSAENSLSDDTPLPDNASGSAGTSPVASRSDHQHPKVVATTTVRGQAELATQTETEAGTDTGRAVTPASLSSTLARITQNETDITNLENGRLESVVGGTNITVDDTDTLNPIIDLDDDVSLDSITATTYNNLPVATTTNYGISILDRNFINGLVPKSNRTTNNTSIDLTAGKCLAKDESTILTLSDVTDTDMESTDNTAITNLLNNTFYNLFLYKKNDDTYNLWLDTTLTPTITNIKSTNAYREIFSFRTSSIGDMISFYCHDERGKLQVVHKGNTVDISLTTIPTTSRTAYTLSVPPLSKARVGMTYGGSDTTTSFILLTEELQDDVGPSKFYNTISANNAAYQSVETSIAVNSSSQIYLRGNDSNDEFHLSTMGYELQRINN